MKYQSKKQIKKEIVAEELSKIHDKRGVITPQAVINEVSNEEHPLHQMFDWDDTTAAKKYRLWQARKLIKYVEVELFGRTTPKFWHAKIQVEDVETTGYFKTEDVLDKTELYNAVLEEALKQIRALLTKYNSLKEIKEIVDEKELGRIEDQIAV